LSDLREKAKVSPLAKKALSQARPGALVIASSKAIVDDDDDPPSIRAKGEYLAIVKDVKGEFRCLADGSGPDPMEIEVLAVGPKVKRAAFAATLAAGTGIGSQPFAHGASEDEPWRSQIFRILYRAHSGLSRRMTCSSGLKRAASKIPNPS
jgi:hypothetical protein